MRMRNQCLFLFAKLICLGILIGYCAGWLCVSQADGDDWQAGEVVSVALWAEPANWDRDLEADGWRAGIRWLDARGMPVVLEPAGQSTWLAHFQWTPLKVDNRRQGLPYVVGFPEMQWTVRIAPETLDAKLPFRGSQREWMACGAGVLRVRIAIPGRGVVENATIVPDPHPILVDTERNYR